MSCATDDGDITPHMAPPCRGGQLDRRDDLFVPCACAGTQARAVCVTEIGALSDHGPSIPAGGLDRDRRALVDGTSVGASAWYSDRKPIGMAHDPGSQARTRDDPSSLDLDP